MFVNRVTNTDLQYKSPVFKASCNLHRLKFNRDDFFVNIEGYGRNTEWADNVIKIADDASDAIRQKLSPETVLQLIISGIKKANAVLGDLRKGHNTGILRTKREGWDFKVEPAYTRYVNNRYSSYVNRLNDVCTYPLMKTSDEFAISRPVNYFEIEHGSPGQINNSLNYIFDSFKKIFPKYLLQDVKPENLAEINSTIAEIRWVLAHATPWARGSDAISNVFMRSMYKACGVKTYPLTKGVSLDLEAYCTELPDYIKKFPEYFEKAPEILE